MSRDERSPDPARLNPPHALVEGEMEVLGLMPYASNYTFLARCTAPDSSVLAIYKPRRGEIPLWDFPDGTLHRREVAAFEVSRTLGWPNIPPTIVRGGPEGVGSAQLFVRFDPAHHYFTLEDDHADAFRRVALFDVVVNNADRKAGHCLLGRSKRPRLRRRPRRRKRLRRSLRASRRPRLSGLPRSSGITGTSSTTRRSLSVK